MITGFFGVDNPREHYRDFELLSSIQFFIMNRMEMKNRQEQLQYLSFRDMLTNLYNRNCYIRLMEGYRGQRFENIGVVFPGHTYRIGGDELVVIYLGILEQQFEFLMNQLRLNARQHHVSISCGAVWSSECFALDEVIKEADAKMYKEKKKFYERKEHDRRREIRTGDHM